MLGKKLFLTTFCSLLLLSGLQAKWEKVSVASIIASDHYFLTNGEQVKLAGISGLDWLFPHLDERCLTESAKILLTDLFLGHSLKIKLTPDQPNRTTVKAVFLKFSEKDLGMFLLSQGLATVTNLGNKDYVTAQRRAQKAQLGRWGQCDPHLKIKKWEKQHGRTPWFWQKYHQSLRGTGVGKVVAILPGNILKLQSGLQLHLESLRLPDKNTKQAAEQCFLEQSRQYLEDLVLGKNVTWSTEQSMNLYDFKTLSRQVYLPKTSWRPEIWLNKKLITDGYARATGNLFEYEDWANPVGAWKQCLSSLIQELP